MNIRSLIGDRKFYSMVLAIAVPMIIQNGLTNFVSLLDNVMIGGVGTNAISGVAIANQLIFVFWLLMFGATCGVGIFTAQFFGKGDTQGVRDTFRFKLIANTVLAVAAGIIYYLMAPTMVSWFLEGDGTPEDAAETLEIGVTYINIIIASLVPIGLSYAYAGTLRDTGNTRVPMVATIIAIFVNLIGNAILIYGLFGLPAMGASGAAVATVVSRYVELLVLMIYTGSHSSANPFIIGAFRSFRIPLNLVSQFILKSLPLMANETLWAFGMTVLNQCYSYRSLNAVAAVNIESTLWNLLTVAFVATGECIGIVVGQKLGAGEIETAKDYARKMRALTVFFAAVCGVIMMILSPFFPLAYKTTDEVRSLATILIFISGIVMPLMAFTHASYFIIRSGGNTLITFIFDCGYTWVIVVPLAYCLSRYTSASVPVMMFSVQWAELIKCAVGEYMVRSGIWAKNIVNNGVQ